MAHYYDVLANFHELLKSSIIFNQHYQNLAISDNALLNQFQNLTFETAPPNLKGYRNILPLI